MVKNKIDCEKDVSESSPLPPLEIAWPTHRLLIFLQTVRLPKVPNPCGGVTFCRLGHRCLVNAASRDEIGVGLLHRLENPFSEDHKLQRHVRQHRSEQWVLERE